jgi:hypothetical protein
MQLPESATALIDELDRLYPERLPEVGAAAEEIHRYAGKREVVLFLKHWRDTAGRPAVIKRSIR